MDHRTAVCRPTGNISRTASYPHFSALFNFTGIEFSVTLKYILKKNYPKHHTVHYFFEEAASNAERGGEEDDLELSSSSLAKIDEAIAGIMMTIRSIGPRIISLKRQQVMNEGDEVDDLELSSSSLAQINQAIAEETEKQCTSPAPSSEEDSDQSLGPEMLPVPVDTTTATEEEHPASPQPGPSNYEDVTFVPPVTSTPRSNAGDSDEDVEMSEVCEIKKQMRNGEALISQIEFEFLRDIFTQTENAI